MDSNLSDAMVVKAARVSTQGAASRGNDADRGLIRFLLRNGHWSPFEHGTATFLVEAPIFVAREWLRHKSWSFNEESARYRQLEPRFYVPDYDRPILDDPDAKPGQYKLLKGGKMHVDYTQQMLLGVYEKAYQSYQQMMELGVAREVARAALPVGIMTHYYASANARSILHFLKLRDDDAAQYEIRKAAQQMRDIFATLMPITWDVWHNELGEKL